MDTTHEVEVLSGLRGRIDTWKSDAATKVNETRVAVRDGARTQMTKVETSMRTRPMLWAGVAAGTGFGLGLIGRIAQWRHKQRHAMPDIVIIEATC
jgi:ElaB/YqjD/DUF883 family membrane-anchored ribosome-binding protein